MLKFVLAFLFLTFASLAAFAGGGKSDLSEPLLLPNTLRQQPPELPKPKQLTLSEENYPRTNGSTSAEPLGVWIACRVLGRRCDWPKWNFRERHLRFSRDNNESVNLFDLFGSSREKSHDVCVSHDGTHDGYVKLINGDADLIYECRRPSDDEKELMREKGVELDIRSIALDAFVFLRNSGNPVESLTLDQVREIFTPGKDSKTKIWNWKQVGGLDEKIQQFTRNRNSGSQETMESLVMKGQSTVSGGPMVGMTMGGPFNRLFGDRAGIGYTFFYYHRYMAPSPRLPSAGKRSRKSENGGSTVKMFAIDGVAPTRESIWNNTYPLITEVYAVTRKDVAPESPIAKLRDWLTTEEGRKVIAETGYVPMR